MIKVKIIISDNSAPNLFCPKRNNKNENMIINKMSFGNPAFYSVLSIASIIYVNKNIVKAQPWFRGQVEVTQPSYYTLISMIKRRKVQKLV